MVTVKKSEVVYEWDNVNYYYPHCGGTIGIVFADGRVVVEHQSNIREQSTGSISEWMLKPDALAAIIDDPETEYNYCNTYSMMLQGSGLPYIADFVRTVKRGRIVT